jgi:hypothetical protein
VEIGTETEKKDGIPQLEEEFSFRRRGSGGDPAYKMHTMAFRVPAWQLWLAVASEAAAHAVVESRTSMIAPRAADLPVGPTMSDAWVATVLDRRKSFRCDGTKFVEQRLAGKYGPMRQTVAALMLRVSNAIEPDGEPGRYPFWRSSKESRDAICAAYRACAQRVEFARKDDPASAPSEFSLASEMARLGMMPEEKIIRRFFFERMDP